MVNAETLKLKIDRLKEQIGFWDQQVIKLIEKADAATGDAKEKYNKRIDELQNDIVMAKKEINQIQSKLENGVA